MDGFIQPEKGESKMLICGKIISLIFFIFYFVCPVDAFIQVSPQLIELNPRNRTATLTLYNLGEKKEKYRIYLSYIKMDEYGEAIEEKPDMEDLSAIKFIRFMPHTVTLSPGEHQVARLRLKLPSNISDGEYRAHMFFHSIEESQSLEVFSEEENVTTSLEIAMRLGVPIIVTKGELIASGKISDIEFYDIKGKPHVKFLITATGDRSLRGDIKITLISSDERKTIPVSQIKEFVVYTPGKRIVTTPLENLQGSLDKYKGWKLHIIYHELKKKGGMIVAEIEVYIK